MTPTVDDYVEAFLTALRAPVRERTVFGSAGKFSEKSSGERRLFGPDGRPFRVIERPDGGTQIETDNRLHAVVRPNVVQSKVR